MTNELKFCEDANEVIPMELNGFMQLADSSYTDATGVRYEIPTPEGFTKADHICWNGTIYDLLKTLSGLNPDRRYNVLIKEVGA